MIPVFKAVSWTQSVSSVTKFLCLIVALSEFSINVAAESGEGTGAQLFNQHCMQCHGGYVAMAPQLSLLQIMSTSSVLRAMESGAMKQQAAGLSASQKHKVAEFLTGQSLPASSQVALPARCESAEIDVTAATGAWQSGVDLQNHRKFDASITSLSISDMPKLKLKWAFAYPDAVRARSQPLLAGGAVFVGGQNGSVFSLDADKGCLRWEFSTVAEVRTGIVMAPAVSARQLESLLFFGDLVGYVYALNAATGELVWRDRPDEHPSLTLTAAPAYHAGRLYVPMSALEVTAAADPKYACCTFRGGVAVYEASTGKKLWTGYTIDKAPTVVGHNSVGTARMAPSGAPIWNTPALDLARGVMYVGTGENYSSPANETSDAVLALSLKDGHIVWTQQMTAGDAWNMGCETAEKINCPLENGPDYDFGAAVIVAQAKNGKAIVIAGQKSGDVYGLDPDKQGTIIWHRKLGRGGIQGGVHFGMAVDGNTLYVPMSDFDGGPRWPGVAKPGMFALDVSTGATQWFKPAQDACEGREFCQPGLSAAASALPGGVLAGAMDGHLRAYQRDTGDIIWDYDTAREFQTVNGGSARGGSIGGVSGPVLYDNKLFVNSGYGIYFHMPGNVLLAFERPD